MFVCVCVCHRVKVNIMVTFYLLHQTLKRPKFEIVTKLTC